MKNISLNSMVFTQEQIGPEQFKNIKQIQFHTKIWYILKAAFQIRGEVNFLINGIRTPTLWGKGFGPFFIFSKG